MKLFICVVVLLVLSVDVSDGCSKEWLKFMILKVCTYAKRLAPFQELKMERTMSEIEDEFSKLYGNEGNKEDNAWKLIMKSFLIADNEKETGRIKRLKRESAIEAFHIGELAGLDQGWAVDEELLGQPSDIRRRHLKNLIKKCCRVVCTVEDIRGACY